MSELSSSDHLPYQLRLLYCEVNGWHSIVFNKSACGSYYYWWVPRNYHRMKIGDLLDKYGIVTVEYDGNPIILNRGDAVKKLKELVASQEKDFDDYCLQNDQKLSSDHNAWTR